MTFAIPVINCAVDRIKRLLASIESNRGQADHVFVLTGSVV